MTIVKRVKDIVVKVARHIASYIYTETTITRGYSPRYTRFLWSTICAPVVWLAKEEIQVNNSRMIIRGPVGWIKSLNVFGDGFDDGAIRNSLIALSIPDEVAVLKIINYRIRIVANSHQVEIDVIVGLMSDCLCITNRGIHKIMVPKHIPYMESVPKHLLY
jgi:hypothetical protein